MSQPTSVEAIDARYLTNMLQMAGFPEADVTGFTRAQAGGIAHNSRFVHRIRLTANGSAPASLILKEVHPSATDPGFARREIELYRSGFYDSLGERLLVPRVYHIVDQPESGLYWLFLEDLPEAFSVDWTPDSFAAAMRNVAELHARWWGREEEVRRLTFLKPRAHAMYNEIWADRTAANCAAVTDGSPVARVFTPDRLQLLNRLSRAADAVLPALGKLPQTVLHHDVWLPNLGRVGDRTLLIDWAFAGPGTPGSELSQTMALLCQMWGADFDENALLHPLYDALTRDWGIRLGWDDFLAGYEIAFCLRPAHALGGPILGGIVKGTASMVGGTNLDERLAAADATLRRIERGIRRL